ncbi:RNA-binding protein 34 [Frankliniella fusca]|uniref:RNA-binding protein 34 n=1 Tax=Frankliniella fusca TaxID=407009 RepID=A0AAE1HTI3_9NEOP|nr:RNA-binding protein 34 [Frankliniella fusca]
MGKLPYKKFKPIKVKVPAQTVPVSTLDLSKFTVSQDVAERSVCVYGISDDSEKWKKKIGKCGEIEQMVEDRGGLIVTFSSDDAVSSAILKLHGKKAANQKQIVACRDFNPPILASGHKQDLFVIRDVPDEIDVPQLWSALSADECGVSHMSFLPTLSRHVVIQCKNKENHQALLEKSGTRLANWRIKVELWFEFCFQMTRRNVVLIENLPNDSTITSVKKLIGVFDGIELMQIVPGENCALVFCKSKDIANLIINCGQDQLKINLYQQTAGLRYMAFIDNLHETTKEPNILNHFRGCGNILKVNLSMDQKTGLKRAVVYFEEEQSVQNALQFNGSELLGHNITVSQFLKKSSNSVFLTNLHRGATGLNLCLIFQDCGHIESVRIPKQKNIVNSREAGVVTFRDAESIPKALEKSNQSKIRGMRIVVHQEDPYEHRGKRGKTRKNNKRKSNGEGAESPTKKKRDSSTNPRPNKD